MLSALWVVIIFVVMLMILYPTAWRNVLEGLKKREERIRKDIAEAEAARTIRDNFIQPTVNALGYSLDRLTLRWAAPPS